jgi:hypothetical protein
MMGFTPQVVQAFSPIERPRPARARIAIAVGIGESDEFKRQAARLAQVWGVADSRLVPGNHFTLLDGLNGGELLDLARQLAQQ